MTGNLESHMQDRRLTTVKLKITTRCNRACRDCIFSEGMAGRDMQNAVLERALCVISEVAFDELHINGGEPTLHEAFKCLSDTLRCAFPLATMKLGTNVIRAAHDDMLLRAIARCYDVVLIGCDDSHRNVSHLIKVLPALRRAGIQVVVNSVIEWATPDTLVRIARLCEDYRAVHVLNHVHHVDVGQPEMELTGLCTRYERQHLMVDVDGACYRCFNAMSKVDSEFTVFDEDVMDRLFASRRCHYSFCKLCHEYSPREIGRALARSETGG